MSTAIVSAAIYDLNLYYKSNNSMPSLKASHLKTLVERKVIGTSASSTATSVGFNPVRRNSGQCCASIQNNNNNNNNIISSNNNRTTSNSIAGSVGGDLLVTATNKLNNSLSALSLSNESLTSMTLTNNILNQPQTSLVGHRKLDRSMSEPVEKSCSLQQQQQQQQPLQRNNSQGNSSRYKTELCRPYEENGTCKYGDKCQFAHGYHELRNLTRHPKYKTELCRTFHTVGFCPYGPRCHFIHNADESRKSSSSSSDSEDEDLVNSPPPPPPSQLHRPPPPLPPQRDHVGLRPKALSIGSFSMTNSTSSSMSIGGESPPSSILSESPTTSLGSFFEDPFSGVPNNNNNNNNMSSNNTANNAFTFSSQDFTSALMSPGKNSSSYIVNNNNNNHHVLILDHFNHHRQAQHPQRRNTLDTVYKRGNIDCFPIAATSPIGSDRDESLSSGSPPPPTCTSPLDISRNLRLPIFSQLSIGDD